jgi:glucan biosynthesis protein C
MPAQAGRQVWQGSDARTPGQQGRRVRRAELDWLRALVVLGLIPFHVAIIFTQSATDYVKNSEASPALTLVASFISYWGMPLLFFVAGAGAWFALEFRSAGRYARERFTRLVIPFVFGVLAIVPVQVYFGYLSNPSYHDSYVAFYLAHLRRFAALVHGIPGDVGNTLIGHLWFIPLLLFFSLATLPLFLALKRPGGLRLIGRLALLCERRGGIFMLALPLAALDLLTHSGWPEQLSRGAQLPENLSAFLLYLYVFVFGYILYADARLARAVRRERGLALGLGALCWLVMQWVLATHAVPQPDDTVRYVAFTLMQTFTSWLWIIFFLALAMSFFARSNRLLPFLSDSAYPVYVLHMPVLTIVGFYVVRWPIGMTAKYVAITLATAVITLGLYMALIRPSRVLRFLFGMKSPAHAAQGRQANPKDGNQANPKDGNEMMPARVRRSDERREPARTLAYPAGQS